MTTPLIETVRDIPLTEKRIPLNEEENSGFPFDDQDFDRGRTHQSSFRTQLDDLARRHPEFAQHLNIGDDFPFRSHTLGRHRRGSDTEKPSGSQDAEFGRRHVHDSRPFSRFEHFESPFRKYFEEDVPDFYEVPHHHQVPHNYPTDLPEEPTQQHYHQQQKSQPSSPQPSSTAEKPPVIPQNREGGRKQNIQQSNTVDLGQKQTPVDENRGQRSMSAPPENRSPGQRFVTSINIPIQRTGGASGGDSMGNKASTQAQEQSSQPHQSNKPNERVIPIHVEGRDEPIIPKNTAFSQAPPQQQQQPDRLFGKNPTHFAQYLNKGEPHVMTPEDYYKQQQQQFQQKQQQQEFPTQQQTQTQPPPAPQNAPQAHVQPQQQAPPPSQSNIKSAQLDQIQNIQKDVSELMNQVEIFNGKPRDKQYLYLDEMLTRNLIKLDNIETEGKDNIRQARKEAIKCIEGCIGILEAKANANLAAELQKQQENPGQSMEVIAAVENSIENVPSAAVINEDKTSTIVDNTTPDANQNAASLEVSGVSRTGSVVNVTPMEVTGDKSKTEVPAPTPNTETQSLETKENPTLPTDTEKPEENKEANIKKDEVTTQDDATVPETVVVPSNTAENAPEATSTESSATSQNSDKDLSCTEDKKEKKKGKKKERNEQK